MLSPVTLLQLSSARRHGGGQPKATRRDPRSFRRALVLTAIGVQLVHRHWSIQPHGDSDQSLPLNYRWNRDDHWVTDMSAAHRLGDVKRLQNLVWQRPFAREGKKSAVRDSD